MLLQIILINTISTAGPQHGREAGGRGDGTGRGSTHRQQGQECQVTNIDFHRFPDNVIKNNLETFEEIIVNCILA